MNHCIHSFIYACFLQRLISIIIIRIRVYCFLCSSVGVERTWEWCVFSGVRFDCDGMYSRVTVCL